MNDVRTPLPLVVVLSSEGNLIESTCVHIERTSFWSIMEDLMAMGFSTEDVLHAWEFAGGNFELALENLLNPPPAQSIDYGGGTFAVPPMAGTMAMPPTMPLNVAATQASDKDMFIPLAISQYSFSGQGTSACTAIASSMMKYLLEQLSSGSVDLYQVLTPNVLTNIIISGVEKYNRLFSNRHLAVDELGPEYFDSLQMVGSGVTQGFLTDPNAFHDVFDHARHGSEDGRPIGIVITKPPETVCVVLPPKDVLSGGLYFFFDSHARPQDGMEGAYMVMFRTEQNLIVRLKQLFPSFSFGADGGSSGHYGDMYNMFEATVFQTKT